MIKIDFYPEPKKEESAGKRDLQKKAFQLKIHNRVVSRRMNEIQQNTATAAQSEFRSRLTKLNEKTKDSAGEGGSLLNPPLNHSSILNACACS